MCNKLIFILLVYISEGKYARVEHDQVLSVRWLVFLTKWQKRFQVLHSIITYKVPYYLGRKFAP